MEIELSNGQLKLWQWDTEQKVKVPENVPTVHFKFGSSAVEIPVADRWVKVPNELLQTGKDILLWTYKEDHTLDAARIPVERRPKPDGYAYTPTEVKTWESLDARIKKLEAGGGVAGVSSVNGETGHVTITASGIGAATPDEVTSAVNSAWAEAQKTLGPLFDAKQPKGDYITQDGLQSATNAALAQAKASGEFDGAPGAEGPQGPTGDTGQQGPTGPQGPAGAGLDVTGATVGQTVKIAAVDDNGVPTAWVPVDMASGGGAKGEPTLIAQIDFEQNSVHVITQSELANLTELIFISLGVKSTATIQSYYALYINDQRICANLVPIQVSSSSDSWNFAGTVRYNGIFWEPRLQNTHAGADPTGSVSAYISSSQSGILGVGPATKITLMVPNPLYKAVAGTLSIYGR
jgi:hypothetical protein